MKKKLYLLLLIVSAAAVYFAACRSDRFLEQSSINIDRPVTGKFLGELFTITGFVALQTNDMDGIERVRGIDKILFSNDKIIALDNDTDFENIWVFDAASGRRLGKLDYKSGNNGLQDISTLDNGNISCLAADRRAFMEYDLEGKLQSTLFNGVIGDMLVCLPGNQYMVYNEYSATEVSGYYQLLFFDKTGNLVEQLYPYGKSVDNIGYRMSGFVSKSGNQVWFSPPFCDTVYEVLKKRLVPRYVFDFGSARVPDEFKGRKLSGWDVDGNAYLWEGFIKIGPFVVFKYYANDRINTCLFDERTKQYFRFRDAGDDYLSQLLRGGSVFPKDDDTFAFLLMPGHVRHLLKNNLLDMEGLKQHVPALHAALLNAGANPNPILLYLGIKPGMRIESVLTNSPLK